MKPIRSDFGQLENKTVSLYTLTNANGMVVKIMDYGATITSIQVPDKEGKRVEIACGFDTWEGYFSKVYKANAPYFGCTVGRYASQIKDAKFTLNGKTYPLAANCGNNNLHGGKEGFDKKIWNTEVLEGNNESAVKMSRTSLDMEEGFPGNVEVSVTFSLNKDNELRIDYSAKTDADTPLSLTNHTYFNLSGFESSVENHTVQLQAEKKQIWDDTGAATGEIISVIGKADDLRKSRKIRDVHNAMGDGFEHYYIFDKENQQLEKTAEINCPESCRTLEVFTSEPGMLLYTGKYTADGLERENGDRFGKYRGFCCEAHRYPNGPNIQGSPASITKAGEEFKSTTIFRLRW